MSTATAGGRRELGVICSYGDLLAAFRAQVANLNINYATLDELAGYTSTYSTKVLAADPARHFSKKSFENYLSALCIDLVAYHNPEKHRKLQERFKNTLVERDVAPSKRKSTAVVVHVKFSRRFLQKIGRKGGENSRKYLTPEEASALGKRASMARWHKVNDAACGGKTWR